ncbi:unnamed protein product [Linum trigynum]|uniref:Uncharacterized protein n=1 Tax=Linum trigynum TaxID=586398 RepID=A0AAV2EVP4_9ROSI
MKDSSLPPIPSAALSRSNFQDEGLVRGFRSGLECRRHRRQELCYAISYFDFGGGSGSGGVFGGRFRRRNWKQRAAEVSVGLGLRGE